MEENLEVVNAALDEGQGYSTVRHKLEWGDAYKQAQEQRERMRKLWESFSQIFHPIRTLVQRILHTLR